MEYTDEKRDVHKWMDENKMYYTDGGNKVYQFSMSVVIGYAKHFHEQQLAKSSEGTEDIQSEEFVDVPACPVILNGRSLFGIKDIGRQNGFVFKDFDFGNMAFYTDENLSSTFVIGIPISSLEYRLKNPTQASIEIDEASDWTIFEIYSDWGARYTLEIHNSLNEAITLIKNKAFDQGLLN